MGIKGAKYQLIGKKLAACGVNLTDILDKHPRMFYKNICLELGYTKELLSQAEFTKHVLEATIKSKDIIIKNQKVAIVVGGIGTTAAITTLVVKNAKLKKENRQLKEKEIDNNEN